jgi:hypothetical protein
VCGRQSDCWIRVCGGCRFCVRRLWWPSPDAIGQVRDGRLTVNCFYKPVLYCSVLPTARGRETVPRSVSSLGLKSIFCGSCYTRLLSLLVSKRERSEQVLFRPRGRGGGTVRDLQSSIAPLASDWLAGRFGGRLRRVAQTLSQFGVSGTAKRRVQLSALHGFREGSYVGC